jgi:hypothetical protein
MLIQPKALIPVNKALKTNQSSSERTLSNFAAHENSRPRGLDLDDNLSGRHLLAFRDIDGGNRA